MSSTVLDDPVTAGALLFGDGQDGPRALAEALDQQRVASLLGGTLQDLAEGGRAAVAGEVASAVEGLLDFDVGGLLLAGWCKHAEVRAAARRTVAAPGSVEVVALATHRVTSTHAPSFDLLVNGVHAATVHLELRLEFLLKGLVVTVREGRLVAVRPGTCEVTATLEAEGRRLATRSGELQGPLVIRLGDGVPVPRG
jgi:hypothetical protein